MNINVRQIEFKSSNGADSIVGWLYVPADQMRGAVQISHGMAEHMGRYHDFMRFLAQNGYAACGIDHIGHGRSVRENRYGWFGEQDGWKTMVDDQYRFEKIICTELPGAGIPILLGHSMGSFVARIYASKYPQGLRGLIISGTGRGGFKADLALRMAAHGLRKNGSDRIDRDLNRLVFGHYNDRFRPISTKSDWLSRDPEWVRQYMDDPKCGFVLTTGGFLDLFTLVSIANERKCFENVEKTLPVLLFSGTMDPVGEFGKGPTAVYQRYVKAGLEDVQLSLYDGGRHEMLGEVNRQQVWEDILSWLQAHSAQPQTARQDRFCDEQDT